jgi:hypothetical protein
MIALPWCALLAQIAAPTPDPNADAVLSPRLYPDEHFVRMLVRPLPLSDTEILCS